MRSRYTAYATGAVSHVMSTTAAESPHRRGDPVAWRAELVQWCDNVRFLGLTVHASSEDGDRGRVRFDARLEHGGEVNVVGEDSRFVRRDGVWLYVDGDRVDPA